MAATKTTKKTSAKSTTKKPSKTDPDLLKRLYREMLLIRRFEERAGQLYGMGLIRGYCHLYIGQEAVVTGIQAMQAEQDTVVTAYRDHAHMLACGMEPKEIMAELTGRVTGSSRGKGGSMHMFSKKAKFYGGHGIVGGNVSIGTGLGFAHKYREDGGVAVTYMGDGAANQGQVAESYNMAALWDLPVLYVVENNRYSMGTSTKRHAAGEFHKRGEAFDIPGATVDGMDVFAVMEAAEKALKHVRDGNGPFILEALTYRYRGHSMSDPSKYRTKEEVNEYKKKHDPILLLKEHIEKAKIPEDDIKAIDKEIKEIVTEVAKFAQESPQPDPSELWTDVLIEA